MASKKQGKKGVGEERTPTCEDCGAELKKRDFMVPKKDFMDGDFYCPKCPEDEDRFIGYEKEVSHLFVNRDVQTQLKQIGDADLFYILDRKVAAKADLSEAAESMEYWKSKGFVTEYPDYFKNIRSKLEAIRDKAVTGKLTAQDKEDRRDYEHILVRWWSMTFDGYKIWKDATDGVE